MIKILCLNCNSIIPSRNKYCSNFCQLEYQYKTYINNWKNGFEDGMRGDYQISMHIKTYLFNVYSTSFFTSSLFDTSAWNRSILLNSFCSSIASFSDLL